MKLILTLIKNEYIKLFKRKSVPILLLILMLFVFGISLIKPYSFAYYNDYQYQMGNLQQSKQEYQNRMNSDDYFFSKENTEIKPDEDVKKVINEFYETQIALCDKGIALLNEDSSDWRIPAISTLMYLSPIDYMEDYVSENRENADKVKEFLDSVEYYSSDRGISYFAQLKAIETNDYSESKRYLYNRTVQRTEQIRATLDELKKQQASGTGGSDIDFKIYKASGSLENSERMIKAYKAALDKKIEYNSIQDNTLSNTVNAFQYAMNLCESMLSEEEYEKINKDEIIYPKSYFYTYDNSLSYEDYLHDVETMLESYESKGLVGLYSLENDVTEMSVADSSRYKSLSYVNLFWLIAPLAIFFASGMVSKEFSTKTINLLLIRPVKRWKILLSKYICLLSLTFGMIVVYGLIYMLGTGISFGFADFSQPYIYVSSGAATSTGFIGWFLLKVLIASIPVFCLVNLTFLFSTVTKGTAVSLILGVLSLFSSILILFFYGIIENPDIITYMPFPYFSMWSYVFSSTVILDDSMINIFGEIIKTDLNYGVILLIGLFIASTVWAFADFVKKDIK